MNRSSALLSRLPHRRLPQALLVALATFAAAPAFAQDSTDATTLDGIVVKG